MENNDLLTLYLDFDEEKDNEGMTILSFVKNPATEINLHHFNKEEFEQTYRDYPKAATENACRALKFRDNNKDVDCGTNVGWVRANQLCNREKISVETISRMSSFQRHRQNKDVPYDKGCGGLMWDAWGGDEGIEWAYRKLNTINRFSKQEFKIQNDEKRIVTSPVMLAETPILRYSPEIGKYNVKFTEEAIFKMMKKYMMEGRQNNINTNHNEDEVRDGVYMLESYIVDDRNKSTLFPDVPKGTWIASYYIENDEVWNKIKSNEYQGFSIEGWFTESQQDFEFQVIDKLLFDIQEVLNTEETDEVILERIKNILGIK